MKKKLSYRDKLVELAYIYDVKEIKEYEKRRKNLTSGQLELILKKNKIIIPKDYKSNFLRDNFVKPITKIKSNFEEYKDEKIKEKNRLFRKAENFKHDSKRKFNNVLKVIWNNLGKAGLNFLNIIPKLGTAIFVFFARVFTDLFNGIYNQQIDPSKARNVIISIFAVIVFSVVAFGSLNYFKDKDFKEIVEIKEPKVEKTRTTSKDKETRS